MPVDEAQVAKKAKSKTFLKILLILFTVVLPTAILVFGILYSYQVDFFKQAPKEEIVLPEGALSPSQLLEGRGRYQNEKVTLVGRVTQGPVACERQECPEEDRCCGCPEDRNLLMADAEQVIFKESMWRLRLLQAGGQAFCRRQSNSCDYDCSDWKLGDVYEVRGTFFAEPPPRGTAWKTYFDVYLEVDSKTLAKESSLLDFPGKVIRGIQELIGGLKTSGHYVLP